MFITHFHEDHVGALNLFAHAPVYLGAAEYAAHEDKVFGLVPLAYPPSIAAITDWRPLEFTGPTLGGFTGSSDVFGDGSVIALPTLGHSPGSTSVLVRFLLAGDAMYTSGTLPSTKSAPSRPAAGPPTSTRSAASPRRSPRNAIRW